MQHSHQAQREIEVPSHRAHRDLKMPLTSDTTVTYRCPHIGHKVTRRCLPHRDQRDTKIDPHIGHNVIRRCYSHTAKRDTEMPSHRAQRGTEITLTSGETCH
ncbi:hypothetical protein DPMN_108096 [Dreissena polymorpha]|uniref:Uncharacterized protein n=1 Tax=Dreissena polymorpha TaxID=45954 RepID=A0A9D4K8F5_DREPO|nr:hypothetical protein DPMN_108096 [Dreissena polymorpha]